MVALSALTCQVTWAVLAAAAVQPVQPHTLTEVARYTFDQKNDQDLDDFPDDWHRRKGASFPQYVPIGIDHACGADDLHSLRVDANGAAAAIYSPLIPVDDLHTYFFSAHLRTEKLKNDAAMISISLLDHRRHRIQRVLTRPVQGNHADWVPLNLGPITPRDGVRFAVIGCHVVLGTENVHDIGGHAWFDNLTWGRLPRMELESNFYRHFVDGASPVDISCKISGLEPRHQYELDFEFRDVDGKTLQSARKSLEEDHSATDSQLADFLEPEAIAWNLEKQPPGFYTVSATLMTDGRAVASQLTTLAILNLIDQPISTGEFGWSLATPLGERELEELPHIAAQGGINWLKYPLWQMADDVDMRPSTRLATVFDQLLSCKISPIALLSIPPPRIRGKFARTWHGVNEVFSLSPEFWEGSIEPVVARYSSSVRYWQLGGESDTSFLGSTMLPQTLEHARQRIQRISLTAQVGIPWSWNSPPGQAARFASLPAQSGVSPEELETRLKTSKMTGTEKWILLRLSQLRGDSVRDKAGELARLMLTAKIHGADRIFVDDVYNNEHGLVHLDGSPKELFIPWRNMTMQLQGAEYLGNFSLPHASQNAVFSKDGRAFVIAWNPEPVTESVFLGVDPQQMDLWGRSTPLVTDAATGESAFEVGPIPTLLLNCSEAIARWRIAVQFAIGRMQSAYGGHNDRLRVTNTFPQGVSGDLTLTLPPEWEAEPRHWSINVAAGETVEYPTYLRLPPHANLGEANTTWDFQITADRTYRFRVHRPYVVGLDDLKIEVIDRKLPDGRLEIEQVITNLTEPLEILEFRCSLFVPDSRRQKLQITKLGHGSDRKFYYLPQADRYRDQELWMRLEQDGGQRILNYRWKVGKDW